MPPEDLERGKNTGVVLEFKPTDLRAGAETAIVYDPRNPSGDWEPYKPTDEWQRRFKSGKLGYDTMSCVTFSAIRIVAMQLEFMLEKGMIPQDVLKKMKEYGYFDKENKINFSEWFSANTNGTTYEYGNSLQAVWDGIRRDGLLPQQDGPSVNDFQDEKGWFDKTRITQTHREKAKLFLTLFDTPYEWAIIAEGGNAQAQFEYHLKHAPLHIITPTCSTWNKDGIVGKCDPYKGLNHATTCIGIKPKEYYKDLDHYVDFVKKLAWDYYIPYAVKGIVVLKGAPVPAFKYTFNVNLRFGAKESYEVNQLQRALSFLGFLPAGVTGPFGPATRAALGKFQTAMGIKDPDGQGMNFGPQTRTALNKAIA